MTTMHTEWTDRLSDYLDDELSPNERRDVEGHVATCAECAAVLDELRHVVARARTIEARPPQADLWPGIERRIDRPGLRRFSFTLPQALAASVAVALLSGAIVWQVMARNRAAEAGRSAEVSRSVAVVPERPGDVATVSYADAQYDAAVSDLETALKNGRGRLDASTIATVEHNLQIIDQAIDQAKQALDADPANNYLSGHLVEARRRKLDLLRRATALTEGD